MEEPGYTLKEIRKAERKSKRECYLPCKDHQERCVLYNTGKCDEKVAYVLEHGTLREPTEDEELIAALERIIEILKNQSIYLSTMHELREILAAEKAREK